MSKTVLYDGECGLCSHAVQFILKHEKRPEILFAALQSDYGQKLIKEYQLPNTLDSMIYIYEEQAYLRSDAAVRIAKELKYPWKVFALGKITPKTIRDFLYNKIAQNRHRFFKSSRCLIPSAENKKRFMA